MDLHNTNFSSKLISTNLVLRKLTDEDANDLYSIYSNEESAKFDDWNPMENLNEAKELIDKSITNFNNKSELRYGIVDLLRGKFVGSCGAFAFDEWNKKCMIFYQIHHDERNKGYATTAIEILIKYIFNELAANRIEAYITPGNDASVRVLEKNGFIKEGILREMEFYKDRFWDGIVMAILRKNYDKFITEE